MSIRRAGPALLLTALLVGACSAAATPKPTSAPTAAPTPPAPTPVVTPAPATKTGFVLRATTSQALSPEYLFTRMPVLVITDDNRAIMPGAQIEIYPGPLLPALTQQAILPGGVAKVLAAAKAAGLLKDGADFSGGALMPGGESAHLTIVADGVTYRITGATALGAACTAADAGCTMPAAGTAEAFAWFWGGLTNLSGWLAADLAPNATPYVASGYSILVGPPPADAIAGNPIGMWPLKDQPLSSFGTTWSINTFRCGTVTDAAAVAALGVVFAKANQLTAWVDSPTQSATRGIVVRPLVPGDGDRCTSVE